MTIEELEKRIWGSKLNFKFYADRINPDDEYKFTIKSRVVVRWLTEKLEAERELLAMKKERETDNGKCCNNCKNLSYDNDKKAYLCYMFDAFGEPVAPIEIKKNKCSEWQQGQPKETKGAGVRE